MYSLSGSFVVGVTIWILCLSNILGSISRPKPTAKKY